MWKIVHLSFLILLTSFIAIAQESEPVTRLNYGLMLKKANQATLNADEKKSLKTLGYNIQNDGFAFETKRNYLLSLQKINEALEIWIALKDTLNEANNRKFKGLLLGYLKDFGPAKDEIGQAISLFESKNNLSGVAVSKFDLSKVYEVEGKIDSALLFVRHAVAYWKQTPDTSRILLNNNQLLNLLIKTKDLDGALIVQKESEVLAAKTGLYWQHPFDLWYLSTMLHEKLNNPKLVSKYKTRLLNDKENLKAREINASSSFEGL